MHESALIHLSYGMYIIASGRDGDYNAMVADAVMQVSSDPARVAASINKNNLTYRYIMDSGFFSISILSQEADMQLIGHFGFRSGRESKKFDGSIPYEVTDFGVPVVLKNVVGYIVAKVEQIIDVGSHSIFIGRVLDDVYIGGTKMTYRYYHEVLKGKTAVNAPTYHKDDNGEDSHSKVQNDEYKIKIEETNVESTEENGGSKMDKYRCTVCGYIYDPAAGDPNNGIEPGTAFEDLPDSWVCPVCGVPKTQFEKVE